MMGKLAYQDKTKVSLFLPGISKVSFRYHHLTAAVDEDKVVAQTLIFMELHVEIITHGKSEILLRSGRDMFAHDN